MTLLFFLRSPAGNTDTGQAPDAGVYYDHGETKAEIRAAARRRRKEERELARMQAQSLAEAFAEEERQQKRKKKRKDEELLLMLAMHEFEGYDN